MDDTEPSQIHATFVIDRTYPVPVAAVWHALSDNDARDQWLNAGEAFQASEKFHEFRVGGHGIEDGRWRGAPGHGSTPPIPTSSTSGASCSPTTCGPTGSTCQPR